MQVDIAEAKDKLTELIKAVEDGETVTICRAGEPVADLVRAQVKGSKPKLGTLKDKVVEIDPDWWKAMTDEEVDDFLEGRY
jgi:prevent-host-death family protein